MKAKFYDTCGNLIGEVTGKTKEDCFEQTVDFQMAPCNVVWEETVEEENETKNSD